MGIQRVSCVGAGVIGHSWATLFSLRGYSVCLCDLTEVILKTALKRIKANLNFLYRMKYIENNELTEALKRIEVTTSLSRAVADADYVQESVYESYEIKRKIFTRIDKAVSSDAIIASSSSGLLITNLQQVVKRPERCLIVHPWNPPHLIPLVELVEGKQTSISVMNATRDFMVKLGKVPIILKKEVPGHIANRLQAAVWREAIDLVDQGVCSVEDVDKALCAGPGIRWAFMGANLTLHLGGGSGGIKYLIEHLGPAFSAWWRDMSTWTSMPESGANKVVKGIAKTEKVKSMTMEELMLWRDGNLINLLNTLYATGAKPRASI